ncbi:MAG: hypothetical protein GF331_04780 [Chitinivibrionales bacterium]|nr:hypothetical protein [Chitinivibrionales bacterium]
MTNPHIPHYHFLPEKGWMNDPNGLVYFRDQWHLFYQFYDPSMLDGMQWGHAISDDLVHWRHLPPAIQPDRHGQIWSGSAVVDHHDTSGLFDGKPGIVCLFTYWDKSDHRQCQGMAYSPDGLTFHTYEGNPVIPQLRYLEGHPDDKDFRDPKVFRHEKTNRWIMAVAGGKLRIFSSPDLIHWTFESIAEDITTECPDLFRLPIDGDPGQSRWVLSRGGRRYMLGDFDGTRFTPISESLTMSVGPDFYATQSFSDAPSGRRVIVSWLHNWGYGSSLSPEGITNAFPTGAQAGGCMTVPYETCLRATVDGPRLCMVPVAELDRLFTFAATTDRVELTDAGARQLEISKPAADVRFTVAECEGRCGLRIATGDGTWISCGYDSAAHALFIDRRRSGLDHVKGYCGDYLSPPIGTPGPVTVRVLLDACSVELFAGDGEVHMSAFVLPLPDNCRVELFGDGRAVAELLRVGDLVERD